MRRAVILTALRAEYAAVRQHLVNPREDVHRKGTVYERARSPRRLESGIFSLAKSDLEIRPQPSKPNGRSSTSSRSFSSSLAWPAE